MRRWFAAAAACVILVPAAPAQAARDTSWIATSAIYEVNVRDFAPSGDLRGVTAGLGRIAAVGANVLWLMPIHPVGIENRKGPLGSPYAVRDYRAIDSAFGTPADFRALVQAVHARGMKIIIDWVPDHTAWDNVWVKEHPDYHIRNERGELQVPRDAEGKPTDWTDVAQLDYKNPALRQAMIAAMRYWLEEYHIDGFRVDAAGFVTDDFWREALPAVRAAAGRRILLLAEWGDPRMHALGFDLTYPWDSYGRLKAVWKGEPAHTFVDQALADTGTRRLRFTTNHDETAWDQPPITLFGGSAGARAAYVAMALLPGRPLIYDGQEVESPQKLGLFVREAVAWNQPQAAATRAFYAKIVRLARSDPAFTGRDFRAVETTAPDDVIAYRRGGALVVVNVRSHPVRLAVRGCDLDHVRDLLSAQTLNGGTLALAAYGSVVVKAKCAASGE